MAKIPVKGPVKTTQTVAQKVVKKKRKGLIQTNPDGTPRHLPGATAEDVADMTQPAQPVRRR